MIRKQNRFEESDLDHVPLSFIFYGLDRYIQIQNRTKIKVE